MKLLSILKLDPERVESRKRLAQIPVADRFGLMFGQAVDVEQARSDFAKEMADMIDKEWFYGPTENLPVLQAYYPDVFPTTANLPSPLPTSAPQDPGK